MNKYLSSTEVERIQQIMADAERCANCTQLSCLGSCPDHVDPRPAFQFLSGLLPQETDPQREVETAVQFADNAIVESYA